MKQNLYFLFIITSVLFLTSSCGDEKFSELDSYLNRRDEFVAKKRARIASVEEQLKSTNDTLRRLELMDKLYDEYYTFRFDSTMICLDQMQQLADASGSKYYQQLTSIHKVVELSTGGFYLETKELIDKIDTASLDPRLKYKYYESMFWAYNYMEEYASGTEYKAAYKEQHDYFVQKCIEITAGKNGASYVSNPKVWYYYYIGLQAQYSNRLSEACRDFELCLNGIKINERLYAMTAMSLANCYRDRGMMEKYEKYVQLAAISDVVCPLKENFALQQFALYLKKTYPDKIQRADKYIRYSLEDARFYNNRLRIVQISNILPDIVEAYQKMLSFRNHVLQTSGIVISIIAIVLIFAFMDIRKKSKKLSVQRQKLEETNGRISSLNGQLSAANDLREQYIHMFLDLCAANINKFDSYRNLVQRKVKARQTDDLLKYSNTTMLSEQEASEFMEKFDNTFLSLYPRFIVQLNTLLLPECQVVQKDSNRLTPEVRIMALMRLGVMESSAIATLLFYTPRTIYNYRSTMKRGAINRETFENDLVHLSGI